MYQVPWAPLPVGWGSRLLVWVIVVDDVVDIVVAILSVCGVVLVGGACFQVMGGTTSNPWLVIAD